MTRKYLPLAPVGMPGVWKIIQNMVPTRTGSYHPGDVYVAGGPTKPSGFQVMTRAWIGLLSDGVTTVKYLATLAKIFQDTGSYTDRSRAALYSTAAGGDWSFAQFGNVTIACNRNDETQFRDSTTATAFANLAGAPKARIVVTQQSQVLLFDLNDGAEKPDYFIACAPGDYTTWSGASATGPNPIWQRAGAITAAVAYRDYVLAFKRSSVYRLTYTGSTFKWRVELIAVNMGAHGKHDVVVCGDVVVFRGPGGAWKFDGASFRSVSDFVGNPIAETRITYGSYYTPYSANAFFWSQNGQTLTAAVYNTVSDRWGIANAWLTDGSNVSPASYRPLSGDVAALYTEGIYSETVPDGAKFYGLNSTNTVVGTPTKWGGGANSSEAYLIGGVEGIGGRAVTNFSGLDLDLTVTYFNILTSDITPGPTELRLDVYAGASVDDYNLGPFNSGVSPVSSPVSLASIASSTKQKRFDFTLASPYAVFKIRFPGDSGYSEVNDYKPLMSPGGSF